MSKLEIYRGVSEDDFAAWQDKARTVAQRLSETALERDRANKDPHEELGWLRDAGLLSFAAPREFGGAGGSLVQALQLSRIISAADGSIGQLIAYHFSNGVWTYILGTPEQWEKTARLVGETGAFQGGVSNPRDQWAEVGREDDAYIIHGKRTFATGASVSQVITVSLWDDGRRIHFQIPPDREGISFGGDWDNLGQRLTASGSVTFNRVKAWPNELLTGLDTYPGDAAQRDGLRVLFSQLIFVNLYLGIAEGALAAAIAYVRKDGRPWPESGVQRAVDDPYHHATLGRLSAGIAAGVALADKAAALYEQALFDGPALTVEQWGELALLTDQAKVIANDISLEVTTKIFEVTGARSTANSYGLDIFWRNVRTHSTHDPVAYRVKEVGAALLTGELPKPRVYSQPPKAAAAPSVAASAAA